MKSTRKKKDLREDIKHPEGIQIEQEMIMDTVETGIEVTAPLKIAVNSYMRMPQFVTLEINVEEKIHADISMKNYLEVKASLF